MTIKSIVGKSIVGHLAIAGAVLAMSQTSAAADAVSDFYKGKNITLIIGAGEGGGYDLSARFIARHLSDHIPDNPMIVPKNMPAASSVAAAEYLYNVAPHDGTTLGYFQPTIVLNKVIYPSAKYEPEKFGWLGRLDALTLAGIVWHTSPVRTIEDAKNKQVIMGALGASGTAATVPWALNQLIGTKFKVVKGYKSSAAVGLAIESGETEGTGSTSWDYLVTKPEWLEQKKIRFLYTIGIKRSPHLPNVPAVVEFAKNEKDRNVLKLLVSTSDVGRALVAPPGVPADRMAALENAFVQTMKDPKFLAEAKKIKIDVDTRSGSEVQAIVKDVISTPRYIVDKMIAVTQPQG